MTNPVPVTKRGWVFENQHWMKCKHVNRHESYSNNLNYATPLVWICNKKKLFLKPCGTCWSHQWRSCLHTVKRPHITTTYQFHKARLSTGLLFDYRFCRALRWTQSLSFLWLLSDTLFSFFFVSIFPQIAWSLCARKAIKFTTQLCNGK